MKSMTLDGERVDLTRAAITLWLHERSVASTMDIAHALAADGAPSGTVVVADEQTRGRGRTGARWVSTSADGLWFTLIERVEADAVSDATSLRLGLIIADVLAPWHDAPVGVKWPNDVLLERDVCATATRTATRTAAATDESPPHAHSERAPSIATRWGKGAGVLVEARWRGAQMDWLAVGVGINCISPAEPVAESLFAPMAPSRCPSRATLLETLIPRLRDALRHGGPLSETEQATWRARDVLAGSRALSPGVGAVDGVSPSGALRIRSPDDGAVREYRAGSLRIADDTHAA